MAPLGEHYDLGFGAVGDAFREAAQRVSKPAGERPILWGHLPETFLLRHAIELYLKSGIIIMHRSLRLPYGLESYSSEKPMMMTTAGTWKALFGTHDLPKLHWYWKKLIVEQEEKLMTLTPHQPDMAVPDELDGWIAILGKIDPSGDYLRYPISRNADADKEKSPFKEVSPDELHPAAAKEYIKAVLVENSKGELVKVFKHDSTTHKDVAEAALKAADMLSGFHAMMRFELTEGW